MPHFDVIVCGTSAAHSLLAAALARSGRSVLHIDANCHYGGKEATISWGTFVRWSQRCGRVDDGWNALEHAQIVNCKAAQALGDGATASTRAADSAFGDCKTLYAAPFVLSPGRRFAWRVSGCDIPQTWRSHGGGYSGATANSDMCKWLGAMLGEPRCASPATALRLDRRFNIDLRPRVVLCRGRHVVCVCFQL